MKKIIVYQEDIIDETEDEICIQQEFEYADNTIKKLKTWQPKSRFKIIKKEMSGLMNIMYETKVPLFGFRNPLNRNNDIIEEQLKNNILKHLNNEALKFIKNKSTYNKEFTEQNMIFELDVESFCKYLLDKK